MVIVCGPTAVGKTSAAIALAQHFNTEIISADSRQVYKELNIGTAKPIESELAAAPHHFINHIKIHENYSAGKYELEVLQKIEDLFQQHNVLICAGGTGLYIKAICEGFDDIPKIDTSIRKKVIEAYEQNGLAYLQEQVQKIDPIAFENVDSQNPQRLMRVWEVFLSTGKTLSSFQTKKSKSRDFDILKIGLNMDREKLYNRINLRVDNMIADGLLKEVESLQEHQQLNALQTVGYSEIFDYFNGNHSLETAIELIKRNSRRYAKRQLTWFRKEEGIKWFNPNEIEEVIEEIALNLKQPKN